MNKVIIIGGGLAGISAGITLLEKMKGLDVTIYNMGHHMGGRATSYRNAGNFNIDHGLHGIFSPYKNMRSMLRRAGVNEKKTLVSNKKINLFYEESTGKVQSIFPDLRAPCPSYPFKMYRKIVRFGRKNAKAIYHDDIEKLDDICYTAWVLEHGMEKEITKLRWFRFSQDAAFNWPHEISAYMTLMGVRKAVGTGTYFYVNGTYGENIIKPLTDYFEKLGGKIILRKKIIELVNDGHKITGIKIANPDTTIHANGTKPWIDQVPVIDSSIELISDFQTAILAVPLDCFRELNQGDDFFWNGFESVKKLRSVVTLSWQVWTKENVMPPGCITINGLDEPMGTVADYKNISDEYRNNPEIGSALEWVGQETSFENKTDDELKEIILNGFLKIPGTKDPRKAGIIHDSFVRNKANYERYLLTDPGTIHFRPRTRTHFRNLFLAGDWVRNEIDLPCMEGAICSGINAASETVQMIKKQ